MNRKTIIPAAAAWALMLAPVHALSLETDADSKSNTDLHMNLDGPALYSFDGGVAKSGTQTASQDSHVNLAALQNETIWGPQAGDWEFVLTGSGASDRKFDTTIFSAQFSVGHFFTENIELALRQSIEFIESDGTDFAASTRVAADYHFDLDRWWPFLGGSFGGVYGDGIDESFLVGLEGGVKWYVRPDTFILGMVEYQWFFESIGGADDAFDDGRWVYTLGIGFHF